MIQSDLFIPNHWTLNLWKGDVNSPSKHMKTDLEPQTCCDFFWLVPFWRVQQWSGASKQDQISMDPLVFLKNIVVNWEASSDIKYIHLLLVESISHISAHSIHGTGIFTYIYHKNQPNVGKYTMHRWYVVKINCLMFCFNTRLRFTRASRPGGDFWFGFLSGGFTGWKNQTFLMKH